MLLNHIDVRTKEQDTEKFYAVLVGDFVVVDVAGGVFRFEPFVAAQPFQFVTQLEAELVAKIVNGRVYRAYRKEIEILHYGAM